MLRISCQAFRVCYYFVVGRGTDANELAADLYFSHDAVCRHAGVRVRVMEALSEILEEGLVVHRHPCWEPKIVMHETGHKTSAVVNS